MMIYTITLNSSGTGSLKRTDELCICSDVQIDTVLVVTVTHCHTYYSNIVSKSATVEHLATVLACPWSFV